MLTVWDASVVTVGTPIKTPHTISIPFTSSTSVYSFVVTNVYTPTDHRDTDAFLADLHTVAPSAGSGWLVIGDFNLTRAPEDKNTAHFEHRLAAKFNTTVDSLALLELPLLDRLYTWSNKRAVPKLARLDQAFMNNDFAHLFPNSTLNSRIGATSDHVPLVHTIPTSIPNTFRFQFKNAWLKHPSFLPSVLPAWSEPFVPLDATGALVRRIKALRHAAKAWSKHHRARTVDLNNAIFIVLQLDIYEESRALSVGEQRLWEHCRDQMSLLISQCAAYWKQRGKFKVLCEGDANTKFFHARASCRAHRNTILDLEVDGALLLSHDAKVATLTAYYTGIVGGEAATTWGFDVDALYANAAHADPLPLIAAFSEQEAWAAIRAMDADSGRAPTASGQDSIEPPGKGQGRRDALPPHLPPR